MENTTEILKDQEVAANGEGFIGDGDETGIVLSKAIQDMLSFDPELPTADVEAGNFQGCVVEVQPPSFVANRKNMRYVASDDPKVGDRLLIASDEFAGEHEFLMSRSFLTSFVRLNDLKSSKYFFGRFDSHHRNIVANNMFDRMENENFRFYFTQNSEDGTSSQTPYLLNMLLATRPTLPDIEVLQIVEDVMSKDGNLRVQNFIQNNSGLFVQIIDPKESHNVAPANREIGDIVELGVQIRNSQIGVTSPEASVYTHRLTCLNGAVRIKTHEAWKLKGLGTSEPELRTWYVNTIKSIAASYPHYVAKMKEATEMKAGPTLLSDIVTRFHLTKGMTEAIDEAYSAEPGDTVWHIANAITRAAHTNDYHFAVQNKLERIGGELVLA